MSNLSHRSLAASRICWVIWVACSLGTALGGTLPPLFSKPEVQKRVVEEREIVTHASLDRIEDSSKSGERKKYQFYATMLVNSSVERAYRVLTDYPLYAKMIPYVERADYSPTSRVLNLQGGLWKFVLKSQVQFLDPPAGFTQGLEKAIQYRVIGGHFKGMTGSIRFQPQELKRGTQGTLVYFDGELTGAPGQSWPPAFVIERGAEIVFGFTAKRMRSYIEDIQTSEKNGHEESENSGKNEGIPKPRSHL